MKIRLHFCSLLPKMHTKLSYPGAVLFCSLVCEWVDWIYCLALWFERTKKCLVSYRFSDVLYFHKKSLKTSNTELRKSLRERYFRVQKRGVLLEWKEDRPWKLRFILLVIVWNWESYLMLRIYRLYILRFIKVYWLFKIQFKPEVRTVESVNVSLFSDLFLFSHAQVSLQETQHIRVAYADWEPLKVISAFFGSQWKEADITTWCVPEVIQNWNY